MGQMTKREMERLAAIHHTHPKVVQFREECEAHAWKNDLKFDAVGMSTMSQFANRWFREHGPLPDSGIRTG